MSQENARHRPRDHISANLPSRDFDKTVSFYKALGFQIGFRDDGWLILSRGPLELEFFHHPKLEPRQSWFSACIRVLDLDGLHRDFQPAGLSGAHRDILRMTAIKTEPDGMRMFAIVDCDGSLLRCIEQG